MIKHTQLRKYYKALKTASSTGASSGGTGGAIATSIVTDPRELIKIAIENARPLMALQRVKVGAVEYTVPTPITMSRSEFEGMCLPGVWLRFRRRPH